MKMFSLDLDQIQFIYNSLLKVHDKYLNIGLHVVNSYLDGGRNRETGLVAFRGESTSESE